MFLGYPQQVGGSYHYRSTILSMRYLIDALWSPYKSSLDLKFYWQSWNEHNWNCKKFLRVKMSVNYWSITSHKSNFCRRIFATSGWNLRPRSAEKIRMLQGSNPWLEDGFSLLKKSSWTAQLRKKSRNLYFRVLKFEEKDDKKICGNFLWAKWAQRKFVVPHSFPFASFLF